MGVRVSTEGTPGEPAGALQPRATRGGPDAAPSIGNALLARAATALAHEAKNPLHTMALHLHLLTEKLAKLAPEDKALNRHATALKDGIGKVDSLLKAFAELAVPTNAEPDLGAALDQALLLFGHEIRNAGAVLGERKGPRSVRVLAAGSTLSELVAHAFLAAVSVARAGASVQLELRSDGHRGELIVQVTNAASSIDEADPPLQRARALARELGADFSLGSTAAGSACLSISMPTSR